MSLVLSARRHPRIALAAVVGVLGLILLLHTSFQGRGQEYITGLLSKSGGWQQDSGSKNPPIVDSGKPQSAAVSEAQYSTDKWFFEYSLDPEIYHQAEFDTQTLSGYAPRNYKGPGHPAFATFFLSRNESLEDPYFMATQQVVYRLLWDAKSRTTKHPVVVFVPPFIPHQQRAILAAAGALVREVKQLTFEPNDKIVGFVAGRLKDVFSKLEMWKETEFTTIAYLDSDAFPIENVDGIFDFAPKRKCHPELIDPRDQHLPQDICDYAFAATLENTGMLNAGVMVFNPNEAMHDLLIREYHDNENFDNGFVEQALLTYVYREDGPFPASFIPLAWNAGVDQKEKGNELFIAHAKLWALWGLKGTWYANLFLDTWKEMCAFYESAEFARIRSADGPSDFQP